MNDGTITMPDGRTVGFADYGTPDQIPVLWCHGGPGCRFEPGYFSAAADRAGLRLVREVVGTIRQMLNGNPF